MAETDPTAIRSLAISPEDAVDAYVYTQENPGEAVLRVTPPFHGRMRARLHVYRVDDAPMTGAVHVDPAAVIADDVLDAYPRLEEGLGTGDSSETDGPDEMNGLETSESAETERLRKRHAEAIERWQGRARDAIVDDVVVETDAGTHHVDVKPIG